MAKINAIHETYFVNNTGIEKVNTELTKLNTKIPVVTDPYHYDFISSYVFCNALSWEDGTLKKRVKNFLLDYVKSLVYEEGIDTYISDDEINIYLLRKNLIFEVENSDLEIDFCYKLPVDLHKGHIMHQLTQEGRPGLYALLYEYIDLVANLRFDKWNHNPEWESVFYQTDRYIRGKMIEILKEDNRREGIKILNPYSLEFKEDKIIGSFFEMGLSLKEGSVCNEFYYRTFTEEIKLEQIVDNILVFKHEDWVILLCKTSPSTWAKLLMRQIKVKNLNERLNKIKNEVERSPYLKVLEAVTKNKLLPMSVQILFGKDNEYCLPRLLAKYAIHLDARYFHNYVLDYLY